MASNLYEVLGLSKDATTEQIRKAYKKMALQTHPDRLSPQSTQEQKKAAEERFRQVNHAYEILTDTEKRREYDIHGVWPPPAQEEAEDRFFGGGPHSRPHHHFSTSFFTHHHPHHHPFSGFAFSDPFELFNSIFRDFEDEGFGISAMHPFTSFPPFGGMSMFRSHSLPPTSPFLPSFPRSHTLDPFQSIFDDGWTQGGSSFSESYSSTTINGVTETLHKRWDSDGNEHVTKTYGDGRKVYTINGIEQPPRGHLAQANPEPRQLPRSGNRYLPRANRNVAAQHPNGMPSYFQPQPHPRSNSGVRYDTAPHAMPTSPIQDYSPSPPPYSEINNTYHNRARRQTLDHQMHHGRRDTDRGAGLYEDHSHGRWGFGRR